MLKFICTNQNRAVTLPCNPKHFSQMKEYIATLNGRRIDSNGFYSSYGVTAYTKAEAKRLAAKAKLHYFGTFKGQIVNIIVR